MGSSQSQPSPNDRPNGNDGRPASRRTSSNPLRPFRRLSNIGRHATDVTSSSQPVSNVGEERENNLDVEMERTGSGNVGKRMRQASTVGDTRLSGIDRKKPRMGERQESGASSSRTWADREDESMPSVSTSRTSWSTQPYPRSTSTPGQSTTLSPALSSDDSFSEERLQTLATIRDTLGPEWPPADSPAAPVVERLLRRHSSQNVAGPSSSTLGTGGGVTAAGVGGPTPGNHTVAEARINLQRAMSQARNLADRITSMSARLNSGLLAASSHGSDDSTVSQPQHQSQSQHELPSLTGAADEEVPSSAMEDLAARLREAREELAETERQLNETRERFESTTERRRVPTGAVLIVQGLAQTHTFPDMEEAQNRDESEWERAQRSEEDVDFRSTLEGDSEDRTGNARPRRASESRVGERVEASSEDGEGVTLQQQANMISGLLTVAAAATATTLLAPGGNRPSLASAVQPQRPSPSSTLESMLSRLRPNRPRQQTDQTVEASLGNYLRNVLRDNRVQGFTSPNTTLGTTENSSTAASSPADPPPPSQDPAADAAEEAISSEFQTFLEGLQGELVDAVRAFAGPLPEADEGASARDGEDVVQSMAGASLDPSENRADNTLASADAMSTQSTTAANANSTSNSIPTFHSQLGQNLPGVRREVPSVTGGRDGVPRRLNFFRVHSFPAISPITGRRIEGRQVFEGGQSNENEIQTESDTARTASLQDTAGQQTFTIGNNLPRAQPHTRAQTQDDEPLIPCIFIGVRSIRHDPAMTTDDLVSHPQFPFVNGEVPPRPPASEGEGAEQNAGEEDDQQREDTLRDHDQNHEEEQPSTIATRQGRATSSPPERDRRSLRERFLSHLRRATSPASLPTPPSGPLNTYLVYVIGGNYPRSHPVLRMPSLIHGGAMTDEELQFVGDLLGSASNQTVEKEKLDNSGLQVVKGREMEGKGVTGEVIDSCVERCLVCLSGYEPEEDCRILGCRHAFHKDCVDQWLTTGKNSCPACRTEAVDSKPSWTEENTATAAAGMDGVD
ncbi:hypothetical protein C343_04895 [Cryptococcus neoformans C23]|uniref:RING-type domain-containing protein n=1 Tax=Cryptococcus neoformans (strain H99 / ATCC 208821 / CBS 10515 / FGSC 9487) TaxID=235443 RepID=J9VR66_CRYN9|nr:hypothetical protein CNAG_03543 [Cryptococcus neoformans var. grubii H99]AFR96768.1 hypothetical protein CNAG_03543 [Cryptococcus neoformans var. grubii H99]AUB26723.1 hypothetical protein CKF44_03543 [Cryptococcus neoformans var. grubii]OWZ29859.1 hypothetical protein C347_04941 [Cryptococcus neoformans var. grubii AD2-60a]OWZ41733.1 hypothetical protein C343_04895 [Cryptococcus neoformans var. grubii C23]|eukprot:XP_012051326.1 hypothetical protein CNAG_03543 [Cryptococcus neoformans var. grubii H99]